MLLAIAPLPPAALLTLRRISSVVAVCSSTAVAIADPVDGVRDRLDRLDRAVGVRPDRGDPGGTTG
ncbi:hypothetical protein AB0J72_02475 [Dactylosporangium sp. NPDC049742]|uniref:hypothetical protein n=1 Tax=Dactylosporangium sp. NPDC049742 TaxID=3154737 RepID=UPI003437B4E8